MKHFPPTRRAFARALLLAPVAAVSLRLRAAGATPIEVWTGPSCSCSQAAGLAIRRGC